MRPGLHWKAVPKDSSFPALCPIFETSAFKCLIRVTWFYFPVSFLYSHILQANCILSLTKDAAHHILPTWGSVQDLPREQHSQLSPGEDTKQRSETAGKEAPAAKGHRALPARKQTLCMWHPAGFIWQVGRLRAHTASVEVQGKVSSNKCVSG